MSVLDIDPDTWRRLNRLLDEALDLPPAEREAWLAGLSGEQKALEPRLRALLAGDAGLGTLPKLESDTAAEASRDALGRQDRPGDRVGPYRLERLLGEGGMGAVWLASRADGILQRPVALKLPRGLRAPAELALRMEREREILASLNHPHIARVYDAGLTEDGQPYLALEYVEGRPIDEYARAGSAAVRTRLRLFLDVAEAVAHAHAQLVVHRDIKPSNILVTDEGGVRLLDFGIAKLLQDGRTEETELTQIAGRALTLAYASPEQVDGRPLGVASDVYSLGVVLYELLTGGRPYRPTGDDRRALEEAILHAEPPAPSQAAPAAALKRALKGDLDTILLKALKKDPRERYATVSAFADDVRRYLDGRPVLARPDSAVYRARKFVGRNRLAVGAAALILAAILAGAGVAVWQARVAVAERIRAEEVKDFIVSIFEDANPYAEGGRSLSAVDLLKQAEAEIDRRLKGRADLRAELRGLVGTSLIGLEDFHSAEQTLLAGVEEASRELGPRHARTIGLRVRLSDAYRYLGKTREMSAELEEVLPELRRRPSELGDELAHALLNRAHLAIDEGRYEAAHDAARESLEVSLARNGEEDPLTVMAVTSLAVSLQYGAAPEAALEAAETAFGMTRRAHRDDPMHPRAIDARAIYGRALGNAGRLAEAVVQLERVVADASAAFGPSSQMVGFYSTDLASYYAELGELERSIENAERALSVLTEMVEPGSFTYVGAHYRRGASLLAARRAQEALPDLAMAVEGFDEVLGPGHERVLKARVQRALAWAYLGRFEAAIAEVEAVMELSEGGTAAAHSVVGTANRLAGRHEEAARWQERALRGVAEGPKAERERMHILAELGLSRLALGEDEGAAVSLERALDLSWALQSADSPRRADALLGLGRVRLARGEPADALAFLESAERYWRGFDSGSRWAGEASAWLARRYERLGRHAEAEAARARAVGILERSPIPGDGTLVAAAVGRP